MEGEPMKYFKTTILALLALVAVSACSSEPSMQDGLWEMTSTMEMEGMPAGMPQMPPMTYRQCLNKERMIPTQQDRNRDCEIIDQDVSGDTVTWKMRCTSGGMVSETSGSSTYSGNTMQGSMQVTSKGMKMSSHVTGKRIGDCE